MHPIGKIDYEIDPNKFKNFKKGIYHVDARYNVDTMKVIEKIGSIYFQGTDITLSTEEVAAITNMWMNLKPEESQLLFLILGLKDDINKLPSKNDDNDPNISHHDIVDVVILILQYESFDKIIKLASLDITIYGLKQMEEAKDLIVAQKPAPFSTVEDTPDSIN